MYAKHFDRQCRIEFRRSKVGHNGGSEECEESLPKPKRTEDVRRGWVKDQKHCILVNAPHRSQSIQIRFCVLDLCEYPHTVTSVPAIDITLARRQRKQAKSLSKSTQDKDCRTCGVFRTQGERFTVAQSRTKSGISQWPRVRQLDIGC
jgi:hypothetical protein